MGWPEIGNGPDLNPISVPAEETLKPEMLDAPELVTKTQFEFDVFAEIPAENGEAPVDANDGLKAVKAPVAGL